MPGKKPTGRPPRPNNPVVGKPGPGRPKGSQNKVTVTARTMILEALDKAGGVDYLVARAKDCPGPFLALVGRVLPLQMVGDDQGGPVRIEATWMSPPPE